MHRILRTLVLLSLFLPACKPETTRLGTPSPAPQPYKWFTASETGKQLAESPDPLVGWRWENPSAGDDLEIYTLDPVNLSSEDHGSFEGLAAFSNDKSSIKVKGTGLHRLGKALCAALPGQALALDKRSFRNTPSLDERSRRAGRTIKLGEPRKNPCGAGGLRQGTS